MTSAAVTASQRAGAGADLQGAPLQTSRAAPDMAPRHDAAEAALRQRARRLGFWLTIASSSVMIGLILAVLLLFR